MIFKYKVKKKKEKCKCSERHWDNETMGHSDLADNICETTGQRDNET